MKLYISYILTAILNSWLITFYYGVSAGFVNYLPILALLGSVVLFALGAPILIYDAQASLILGLICSLLIIPFNLMFLKEVFEDQAFNWKILLAVIPSVVTFICIYLNSKFLLKRNFSLSGIPKNKLAKIFLSGIPILLFVLYILFYGKYWNWQMFKV